MQKKTDSALKELLAEVRARHAKDRIFLAQFNAAQRAWHEFREAEIRSVYAHADDSAVRFQLWLRIPNVCGFPSRRNDDEQTARHAAWLVGVSGQACNSQLPER